MLNDIATLFINFTILTECVLHLQLTKYNKEKTIHRIATFHTTSSEYIDINCANYIVVLMYRDGCVWIYRNCGLCSLVCVLCHPCMAAPPSSHPKIFLNFLFLLKILSIHKQYKLVPSMCTQPWFCIIVWVATCSLTMKMASSLLLVARAWVEIVEDAWPRHQLKIPNIVLP